MATEFTLEELEAEQVRRSADLERQQADSDARLQELVQEQARRRLANFRTQQEELATTSPDFVSTPEPTGEQLPLGKRAQLDVINPLFPEGTGRTIGGAVGTGAAMVVGAGPIGLVLGTALGALQGQATENAARNLPVFEGLTKLGETAYDEAVFGPLSELAGPVLKQQQRFWRRVFGFGDIPIEELPARLKELPKASREQLIMDASVQFDTAIGRANVSEFGPIRGMRQIFGRVPIIGGPFVNQSRRAGADLMRAEGELLDRITPWQAVDALDLGVDVLKNAQRTTRRMIKTYKDLYGNADELARQTNVKFNLNEVSDLARQGLKEPPLPSGTNMKLVDTGLLDDAGNPIKRLMPEVKKVPKLISGEMRTFFDKLDVKNLSGNIDELRNLQQEVDKMIRRSSTQGFDLHILLKMRGELKRRLMNPTKYIESVVEGGVAPQEVVQAYKEANRHFVNTQLLLHSKAAQKLKQVRFIPAKNLNDYQQVMFEVGEGFKGQSLSVEDVARTILDAKSADGVMALRDLLGERTFNKVTKLHLSNAFKKAIVEDPRKTGQVVANVTELRSLLGLPKGRMITKGSARALDEMLKGTGVSRFDLERFVELADSVGDPINPFLFLKRRVGIGGARAGLTGALGGIIAPASAAAGGATGNIGLVGAALMTGITRLASSRLANPKVLRSMALATRNTTPIIQRALLIQNLLRQSLSKEEQEEINLNSKKTLSIFQQIIKSEQAQKTKRFVESLRIGRLEDAQQPRQ